MQRPSVTRVIGVVAIAVVVATFAWAWDLSSQPGAGDGWRLLARQRGIAGAGAAVPVLDQAGLDDAWDRLRLLGDPPPPAIDFGRFAVYWLTSRGSIGCPARLDGLRFETSRGVVAVTYSRGLTAGCDAKVVPDSFLVAIDRSRLSGRPYTFEFAGP